MAVNRTTFNYATDAGYPYAVKDQTPLWFQTDEYPAHGDGDGQDRYSYITVAGEGWGCSQFDYEDQGDEPNAE